MLFRGEQLPLGTSIAGHYDWGDSVLQSTLDDVRNLDATKANVASLVYEAKIDVIKVPELLQRLQAQGTTYENLILQRIALAALTPNRMAAPRLLIPASIAATTRSRRS